MKSYGDRLIELSSLTDQFYDGAAAYSRNEAASEVPCALSDDEKHYWLSGFRNAAHIEKNPFLSVESYEKVADAAYQAGIADKEKCVARINPFDPEQAPESYDIWAAVYFDVFGNSSSS